MLCVAGAAGGVAAAGSSGEAAGPRDAEAQPAMTESATSIRGRALVAIIAQSYPARGRRLATFVAYGGTPRTCLQTGHHWFIGLLLQNTVWPPGLVPPLPPIISNRCWPSV